MPILLQFALLGLVIIAGESDLRVRRIPNWLTVAGVVLGIGLNATLQPHGWLTALLGLLCAFGVYLPLYLIRGMGAGDVKLMAAVGAITGPSNWLFIFLVTVVVAGVVSLSVVVVRRRVRQTASNVATILSSLGRWRSPASTDPALSVRSAQSLRMPHGAFIAIGSMLFLFLSKAGRL